MWLQRCLLCQTLLCVSSQNPVFWLKLLFILYHLYTGQLPPGSNLLLPPAVVLHNCHKDIVRSVDCFDSQPGQRFLCLTAGEDAQLGLWTLDPSAAVAAAPASSKDSGDSAGPARRQHHQQQSSMRRSPY